MKKIRLLFLTLAALLMGVSSSLAADVTVYIDPVGDGTWLGDNAKISVNVYTDGQSNNTFVTPTTYSGDVLTVTFDDSYNRMIIVRGVNQDAWGWNQTEDITPVDNTLYKANGYNDSQLAYTTVNPYIKEPAAGYTCDFNTTISTSSHDFKVAKGWGHIVGVYQDSYADGYMNYSYGSDTGVNGSGALLANRQYAQNVYNDGEVCYDLLVTPTVNGTVTLDVKASISAGSSNNAFVEVYAINSDGTRGDLLKTIKEDIAGYNTGSNTAWATFTLAELTTEQKLGLRCQYVYIDNFTAESVNIPAEHSLVVSNVANLDGNTGTSGTTTYFYQQADGTLKVQLQVTLTNDGDYDYAVGDEGYTLTLASASYTSGTKTYYDDATINVPEALAAGESKTFDVDFSVPYSSGWKYFFVRENITSTTSSSYRYAGVTAYESKFVFREAGSTSSASAQSWGTITESTTKSYEIANTGTAPMTITAITLPDGFTSDNLPEIGEGLVVAGGETVALNITQDASATGTFSGTLTISYIPALATDATDYTLAFSVSVIGANTWTADFSVASSSATNYPTGSVAEAGIRFGTSYVSSGNYNGYLYSYTSNSYATENNKFITPKLHANAGDQLAFDVARDSYGSSYNLKVYVSADRKTWGEPVAQYTYDELSSSYETKTVSFAEAGDYYVAFAIYGVKIDNLVGLEAVEMPAHDLYVKSVSWPDASVKSGTSLSKPTVEIIPLTAETADNYTVKYVCGEAVLAEGTPVALTASANSSTSFSFSWAPEVESTTVYEGTKIVFEFTDGTTFETETFDLTVTNESKFHFVKTMPSSKWYEPSDYTTPITFGKTNAADAQTFYVYNWGTAPLTVKGIAVPAGFTATPAEQFTVAAFDENNMSTSAQAVEITFSATEAGTYSGDMVITYVDGTGADATFTLAVSGTKLDPSKFYANFGAENNQWPAGSVYQSNVSTTWVATGDYAITSTSTTNNIFVTPKLTAADGDKLLFDAKLYSSTWSEGKVVVYAAATRDEVLNAEEGTTRQQLFSVSGQDETGAMTTDYQTFEVPALAGDYYYGFEISNRPYVDEIYGLTVAEVAHDWQIASSNIPAEATQNVAFTATVNILNLGLADEAADSYTVTAYLDGEAVATGEAVAIPMAHQLSAAGTQLSVNVLSTKTGEYPVYLEVKAGDYSVQTEAVNVLFGGEVFVSEAKQVGTQTSTGRDYGFVDWYYTDGSDTRYTDILYTAAKISAAGIKAGDKIKAITFKATNSAKTFKAVVTSWVGTSTGDITYGSPTKADMQEVSVYNGTIDFAANEESVITLSEPIVWDGTSDIRVYTEAVGQGSGNWVSASYGYDSEITMSYNGTTKAGTIAFFSLEEEAPALAGIVKTSTGEGIEGATVTIKAESGATYSGTTDETGAYSFNVIQAGLDFTATVTAEGFLTKEFALNMNGASATQDVTLYKSYGLVGTFPGFGWESDVVMTQSTEDPNIFTLVVKDVELDAANYEYKLRADGIWKTTDNDGYQLPAGGDNNDWTFNLAGKYTLKFTANVSEHTLTLEPSFKLEDNAASIAAANLGGVTITSDRQFKAGWNAIYLPVYVSAEEVTDIFGENAEIAYYAGDEADASGNVTVKFAKRGEGSIEAGVPYLLWCENAVNGFELTGREISGDQWSTDGTAFNFVGTYSDVTAAAGDYFIADGKFVKATSGNTVLPFRSYLKLNEGQSARSLTFVIGDQTTTEIAGLEIEGQKSVEGVYNMQGQKVQNINRKGLYIINGKKVMVK